MTNDKLFTLTEAAVALGQPYKTLYNHTRYRDIPATQIGGKWLLTRKDIEAARRFFAKKTTKKTGGAA